MPKGKVKWFNNHKGYGFIESEDGTDVFVHHSEIQGNGYASLDENQEVEFEIKKGPKGDQATKVVKLQRILAKTLKPGHTPKMVIPGFFFIQI